MKVELYVGVQSNGAKCTFCSDKIKEMQITERCECYCSIACAKHHYIFTFDSLVIINVAGMVPVLIRRREDAKSNYRGSV